MSMEFRLQDPGEGIHEAEILEVHVDEGDTVEEGDDLFTVETDKASVVIPSPFDGDIENINAKKGQTVEVGDVLLTYRAADSESPRAEEPDKQDKQDKQGREEKEEKQEQKERPKKQEKQEKQQKKAKKEKRGKGDKGDTIRSEGSGGDKGAPGRQREASATHKDSATPEASPDAVDEEDKHQDEDKLPTPDKPASPATRQLARELEVDLHRVKGSGPGGRIESADVREAAGEETGQAAETEDEGEQASERGGSEARTFDFDHWGEVETVETSATRRKIAEKMTTAWQKVPHVMHADFVDVSKLDELRVKHAEQFREEGGKLTITVFALKAIAIALKDFPRFNASLDPDSGKLVLKRYCHIGVAIDTREGLLVPVIRDVDSKSLSTLSQQLVDVAEKARAGELKPREMQGGSISLTNPGGLGAVFFTPIINYPEVAIVGLGTVRSAAMPIPEPAIGPDPARLWLPLIVGFDHRVNDGADAARFARRIGHLLEAPEEMLLAA